MMNSCKTLTSFTEDKFLAKAWADYLQEVNNNYSNLIAAVTDASTYELAEGEEVSDAVNSVLNTYGLNGGESLCLSKGFSTVRSVLEYTIIMTEKYGDIEDPDSATALTTETLSLLKNNGQPSTKKASIIDIFDDLKSSLHSSTVMQAAFESVDGNSISDRVTVFKDKVQSKFTNIFDDISSSFTTFEEMIGKGFTNVSTFIGQVVNYMGVNAQATDDNFELNQSDLSQFTGASPLPAVDFTSAGKAIGAVGKVVGQAVVSLFKGIGNIAGKIFSWIGTKVENVVTGYDLELINEDAIGYTIDGWGFTSQSNSVGTPRCNGEYGNLNLNSSEMLLWINQLNHQKDHWIKLNFIGSEFMFNIIGDATYDAINQVSIPVKYKMKPKPLRRSVVISALRNHGFTVSESSVSPDGNYSLDITPKTFGSCTEADEVISSVIEEIKNADYQMTPKSDPELDTYNGFLVGIQFSQWVLAMAESMMYKADQSASFTTELGTIMQITGSAYTVTNTMWVRMASGWNGEFGSSAAFGSSVPLLGSASFVCNSLILDMVSCWAIQQYDKVIRPTDFIFLPYQNDVADFDNSKFGIKTDAANQEALTKFLTVVVAIVIIVTVAVFTGVMIRKISRAKFFKRLEFTSQMDSMMWEGGSMTKQQRRKYIKYSRKLNASSLLTGGLQQSASNAMNAIFNSSDTNSAIQNEQSYDVILKVLK